MRRGFVVIFCALLLFAGLSVIDTEPANAAESSLYWGSRGEAVVQVQQALNARGYWCGNADGIFGAKTYAAVIKFQRDAGIKTTGTVGPLTRQALNLSNMVNKTPSRGGNTLTMVATGYCSCAKCNYPYGGHPSYLGYPLERGIIAVDPKVIPMGTKLWVEGYGEGIAADQGNAIKGNRLDLCFSSHQEALDWGIRTVQVTIL
ncbi:3D domain-containing protein [Syntrophomonas palmitatica]|uniref:3D domain-containing protein n=1 Tax=Syntrophomonas palmitatica TaxID=402877 RepID=UPI0006CFE786|nr:3D domain-containing protein [Syntrophomonas palmitatica]